MTLLRSTLDNKPSTVVDIPTDAISLYSSVTTDQIMATWSDYTFQKYTITSMRGRVVDKGEVVGSSQTLDLSFFPKGSYVITFERYFGIVSKQFVKM